MRQRDPEFQEKLARLRRIYISRLRPQIEELERFHASLAQELPEEEALASINQTVHNLAGSGEIFGFPEISRLAHQMQRRLRRLIEAHKGIPEAHKGIPAEEARELQAFTESFLEACRRALPAAHMTEGQEMPAQEEGSRGL